MKAEGELYVDDGHSFNYKNGEYLKKRFVFDGTKLRSETVSTGSYILLNTIERIVLLGATKTPQKVTLKQQGQETRELEYEYDASAAKVVVRQPNCQAAKDWEVVFEFGWF